MNLTQLRKAVKRMSVDQLLKAFTERFSHGSETIMEMAIIWVELENKGYDTASIKTPFLSFLPEVASGKLLPEVLLRYGSNPGLIEAISHLNPGDQKPLSTPDARVEVLNHEGKVETKRVQDLSVSQIRRQLIDETQGRIRSVTEQRHHLPPAPKPYTPRPSRDEPPEETEISVDFNLLPVLTAEQQNALMNQASRVGLTPAQFAVDFLVRHKILPGKPARRPTYRGATREVRA